MKLNPDCVRDLLMYLEDRTDGENFITFNAYSLSQNELKKYSAEELYYHFMQCNYSNYLINCNINLSQIATVLDISPSAHQFLADIRSNSNWKKVKEIAAKAGAFSIKALATIAEQVVISNITSLLQ